MVLYATLAFTLLIKVDKYKDFLRQKKLVQQFEDFRFEKSNEKRKSLFTIYYKK